MEPHSTSSRAASPPPPAPPLRLRTPAAARHCGLSPRTLEKLRLTGGGPPYLKLGRAVAYDLTDLDTWLAANRRGSTSEG